MSQSYTRRVGRRARALGFTLIEMMVAIAVSLILIGAVLALVVAVLQSNAENLSVTRLTQELRAVALITGKEIRRAGYIVNSRDTIPNVTFADPLASLTAPLIEVNDDQNCIRVGYQVINAAGAAATRTATIARIENDDGVGTVAIGFSDDIAAPVECDEVELPLSTAQVDVTELRFVPDDEDDVQRVRIFISGRLTEGPVSVRGVATRSYVENVYLPSLIAG